MHSPIPWMGGKRRLADQILPLIPPHTCYIEPFAGAASILLMREIPAKVEVLNDLDSELVNFFRVIKWHVLEFCQQFRWSVVSRQMFDWLKQTPPETLTDIQRAARFYYLQKLCFGARNTNRTFGTATTAPPKLNLIRIEEDLSALHARLAHVLIEHLDWKECMTKYDRGHSFFFIDPPYWKTAGYEGPKFALADYACIAEKMRIMKGKAIFTINDHPDIRKLFAEFTYDRAEIQYTVGGTLRSGKKSRELIYRNY
jgi:DNA adenine methylase